MAMDWKSNLRRTQSMKSIPSSCDKKPTWAGAGLRDKTASVSQLVSRYQTTVEVSTVVQETSVNDVEVKPKQLIKEVTPSHLETKKTDWESKMWRNDDKDKQKAPTKGILTRSKSMGSLQNTNTGSMKALKDLFESKAVEQDQVKSVFRVPSVTQPHKASDNPTPVMNGAADELKSSAEEPKAQRAPAPAAAAAAAAPAPAPAPAHAPVNDAQTAAKKDNATRKARSERRTTIGGIDFEQLAASQADEKRRSIADFRDSSAKANSCVSVKAISALYLSKVTPQESTKPAQDHSSESGKGVKLIKMAEDSKKRKAHLPPPPARPLPGPGDISGSHSQQSIHSQLSKENLHQQRQKCELRRLLKHTHPELKVLDDVVDEELAEVLSSEAELTADETGYTGEVLSRRLIFENCAPSHKVSPYTPNVHMAQGKVERGNLSKTSAVCGGREEQLCHKKVEEIAGDDKMPGPGPDPDSECTVERASIDVQATRNIFESRSVNTSGIRPDKYHGKVYIPRGDTGSIRKQKQESQICKKENLPSEIKSTANTKSLDLTAQPYKQGPFRQVIGQSNGNGLSSKRDVCTGEIVFENEPTSFPDADTMGEMIKTSTALFQNNPFIPTNIEREHSFEHTFQSQSPVGDCDAAQDCLITTVKNRAHIFESMPFDKIRQQNQDEIETMVENIKETLDFLYRANAIYSSGAIIEVNETMLAKKAKFALLEGGPEIKYNEVAEGGAQNFILQLLPRTNLKPQITYLKEVRKGSLEASVVNVPTNQDAEFKTANVVQRVEDILNQDNSLRKGVIIQGNLNTCAEVIVYSLYNYFDEEDVKHYCPPQCAQYDNPQPDRGDVSKTDSEPELRKGYIKSTIRCLKQTPKDQTCQGPMRPEIAEKGNVKLFRSFIEKGDLEYLNTPVEQEQELPLHQHVAEKDMDLHHEQREDQAEESTEWVPVDIKKLKNMFSGDTRPTYPKQYACQRNIAKSAVTGNNMSNTEGHSGVSSTGQVKSSGQTQPEACNSTVAPHDSYLQLETLDDGRIHQAELVEVVDDNDEISNLQTAIQSLQQATTEAKSLYHSSQQRQKFPIQKPLKENITSITACNVKHSRIEAELTRENKDHIESELKSGSRQENLVSVPITETTASQEENEEVVFDGKLQAALESLGKSNINVTRGDFKAAMIYRNYSKTHKDTVQHVDVMSVQKSSEEVLCLVNEPKPTQEQVRRDATKEQATVANAEQPGQRETLNKPVAKVVSEKSGRPIGPKPVILPKPEHLKVNKRDIQPTNTNNPVVTTPKNVRTEESIPQPLLMTSVSQKGNKPLDELIKMSQEIEAKHQVKCSVAPLESESPDENMITRQKEKKATAEEKIPQDVPLQESMTETDESPVDFHEACNKFGSQKESPIKNAPVKPKRGKMSKPNNKKTQNISGDNSILTPANLGVEPQHTPNSPSCNSPNTCGKAVAGKDKQKKEMKQEGKVEMREKKGRGETEDERRQRLSVHMDEIMRGNITAAMGIFDNLRKQEELQSILSRVEEIEEDTSEVDVTSLRRVFENVPDWVVSADKKQQRNVKAENKEERMPSTKGSDSKNKSSMAHVFGDLERASEDIMNLKEQTLTKLMEIEEAIKKALYSVSTLKSDSDIAGLSCLFKESLGTVEVSPSSGNINKISIGSSKTKSPPTQECPKAQGNTALPVTQDVSKQAVPEKQQASPPSSPAFISIESAARKTDKIEVLPPAAAATSPSCQDGPKTEEKFCTTKILTCNGTAQKKKRGSKKRGKKQSSQNQGNAKREVSVLEVQTDQEGNSIVSTKMVTENNQIYSSKVSTVVNAQPETTTSTGQAAVTEYTEVQLPINQKP